jgi:hypothetical protein
MSNCRAEGEISLSAGARCAAVPTGISERANGAAAFHEWSHEAVARPRTALRHQSRRTLAIGSNCFAPHRASDGRTVANEDALAASSPPPTKCNEF